jgi:hypothetical protein
MANSIRNILTIYGDAEEADRFTGRFMRRGMEAFMPISPNAHPADKYTQTWGACPEGHDVEILTAASIVAIQLHDDEQVRPQIRSVEHNW